MDIPNYTTFSRRQQTFEVQIPRRKMGKAMHIVIDADTHEIAAVELTTNSVGDSEVLPDLLGQIEDSQTIEAVSADGAYDTKEYHKAIKERKAEAIIPPREGAIEWLSEDDEIHPRTVLVKLCEELGKKEWKKVSGYHRRSLAETAMFRFKCLFSRNLKNRRFGIQVM